METIRCANCDRPLSDPQEVCEACQGGRIATEWATTDNAEEVQTQSDIAEGPRPVWKRFAAEAGGEYESTSDKDSHERMVTAPWKGWIVTFVEQLVTSYTQSGSSTTLYTSVEVPFQATDGLRFRAFRRDSSVSAVGLAIGLGIGAAATIGLALMFVVAIATGRTGPNEAGTALLAGPIVATGLVVFVGVLLYMMRPELEVGDDDFRRDVRVRGNDKHKISAFFANEKVCRLLRDQPRGSWLIASQPSRLFGGRSELQYRNKPDAVVDYDQLRSLYDLVGESLDQLVAMGSAAEDAPDR